MKRGNYCSLVFIFPYNDGPRELNIYEHKIYCIESHKNTSQQRKNGTFSLKIMSNIEFLM